MTEWEVQWALFPTKPSFNWGRFKNNNNNYLKVSENCFKDIQKMKKYSFKKSTKSQAVTFDLLFLQPLSSYLDALPRPAQPRRWTLPLSRHPQPGAAVSPWAGKRAGYSHFSSPPVPCCNSSIPGSCDQETNQCAETITRSLNTAYD